VPDAEGVRASRDGDRYHYYWAARRALGLLDPTGNLHVVGVEGLPEGEEVPDEEVIDVAEYYGGSDAATCTRFRYAQLKHSTLRTDKPIVASELDSTLKKFANIYREELKNARESKLEFVLVANRPLNDKVRLSLQELATGATHFTNVSEANLLRRYLNFGTNVAQEVDFCSRLEVDDSAPGIVDIEQILLGHLKQFLPGGGTGTEMALLMERVSRCATSLVDKHTLSKADLLVALRTTEEELLPAPSAIEELDHVIRTQDVDVVTAELRNGPHNKVLITAIGGVGKSILASTLRHVHPQGSTTIVYDCFAGGDYRKVTSQRHEHHVALTQISNELAARGLCTPLIPTVAADSEYTRVFMRRIEEAASQLARDSPDALLTIVIDAADNAAMAAEEQKGSTFVTDLLREDWPPNARLVQLCRPERKHLLNAPLTGIREIALAGFEKRETFEHLRAKFPDAAEGEAAELHALSDGNPRVQAMAMENAETVEEVLASLALAKATDGQVLDSLLAKQVADVADQGHLRRDELSRLCQALATLHPPIPLEDLAAITSVDPDAIRGFAVALGRGLYTAGNILQFRDEPTETWFRTNHSLGLEAKRDFAIAVKSRADASAYFANTLPQLLLETDMLDELVELALSSTGLPGEADELQAKEIARSRSRFALCAMLRARRNSDAALLAVRAGHLSAGHSRKIKIFRVHSDLTARFLDADTVDALCSGRELATNWPGSNLHVEAALMSHVEQFKDMARSRLRSAFNNFVAILRLRETEPAHKRNRVGVDQVADLAMAAVNIDGPEGGLEFLNRWRPKEFIRDAAAKLCARLADAGRDDDLSGLCSSRRPLPPVQAAVAETMFDYNITPPEAIIGRLAEMVAKRRQPFRRTGGLDNEPDVRGVVWVLVHGLRSGDLSEAEALRILDIHLPSHLADGAGSRIYTQFPTSLLLGFALRARLDSSTLSMKDLASEKLLEQMELGYSSSDRYPRDFKSNIGRLLPWVECWLDALLDGVTEPVMSKFSSLADDDLKPVNDYQTPFVFLIVMSEIATRIMASVPRQDWVHKFARWHQSADARVARSRLTLARIASRAPHLQLFALEVVTRGVEEAQSDRTDADTRIESLIDLARTLLAVNEAEAQALFGAALHEAEQVGDDLYARWQSLMHTAKALTGGAEARRAYRLFQIGEELERAHGQLDIVELAEHLHAMHETTYFAVTSRVRDRRTLNFNLMLSSAFKVKDPERLSILALYPFSPECGWRSAFADLPLPTSTMVTDVFEEFTRYQRTSDERPQTPHPSSNFFADGEEDPPVELAVRFADTDFTTEDGWNEAFSGLGWGGMRHALAEFALDKHLNRRPEVLDALGRAAKANESDFVDLAKAAACRLITPALQQALARLGATMATRFASHICTRLGDDRDIIIVAEAASTTVDHLVEIALYELGRSAHQLTYAEDFYLAARLANRLDGSDAGRVFDAVAELFDDLAPPDQTSDGPYDSLAMRPTSLKICVAGVIWAALGDMTIESRWRAAHATLLLVRLGCADELEALARFAQQTESVAPFVDSRFPFYSLHARMWLLLALSRASLEPNAAVLSSFTSLLTSIARGPRHAANQVLAQQTLVKLYDRGLVALDAEDADVLSMRVIAEWVEMDYKERQKRPNPLATSDEENDSGKYPFFFDFERYWCREVAESFGSTEGDIAQRAVATATTLDDYEVFAAKRDPRAAAGVYEDGRSYPDHGSWPGQDNMSFYMAVHALLGVGAELAENETAYKDPDSPHDSYTNWLAKFLPKRPDCRWLADRRDHPPTPAPDLALANYEPKSEWAWALSRGDFENVAGFRRDWVTVWANFEAAAGELSEDTNVESALVPHRTARALLVALQTSPLGPHSYRAPTTNDPFDRPDNHPFELVPWVDDTSYHNGIDERDERGADIRFPPPRPGHNIIAQFNLVADEDQRIWFQNNEPVFRSVVWTDMTRGPHDRESGSRGELLEVNRNHLIELLREVDMTLVLHVGLRRNRHDPSHRRSSPLRIRKDQDDEFDWLDWSGKYYLIRPDGHWIEY
jgi:hypothetical protein